MQAFTLETTVARPRELVYDYLADVAHHPEFLDHFLKEWHMTREETFGLGAGGPRKPATSTHPPVTHV